MPRRLPIGVFVVLGLPLLVLALPVILPLLWLEERWRRCEVCGRRGAVFAYRPPRDDDEEGGGEDGDWQSTPFYDHRVVAPFWRCEACGAVYEKRAA